MRCVRLVRTADARDQVSNFGIRADETARVRTLPIQVVVLQDEEDVLPLPNQLVQGERRGHVVGQRHDVANVHHADAMLVEVALDLDPDRFRTRGEFGQ